MQETHGLRNALLAVLLAAGGSLYGQAVNGTLLGTLTDSTGAVVPAAQVTAVEINTGLTRSVRTNQSGGYVFALLEGGVYRLTVEHVGFQKAMRDNVAVLVNTTVRVDFELTPGSVREVVNVVADSPVLQTDRSDTGRQIVSKQISDMPLAVNRNFQMLTNLVPGASQAYRPHSEFFNAQDSLATRIDGQSRLANNVQIEGVDDTSRTGQYINLVPSVEAIESLNVTTSNYEAELGRSGGGVSNVILRSGTNTLHGSAFYFNHVSLLGTRDIFAVVKPPLVYNLFGATIGGPIRKNRTFFFGDFQGIEDHRGDLNVVTIPTMAFRGGDFSASPTTIFDPATGSANGTGRQPFAGNLIPANRISPIAQKLQSFIAAPILAGFASNYQGSTVRVKTTRGSDVKVDHLFSDYDRTAVHYDVQRPAVSEAPLYGLAGGPSMSGYGGTSTTLSQNAGVNHTHIFSPSFIAEFRFGVRRSRNSAYSADYGTNASAAVGIPGVNISDITSGLSEIAITGYSTPVLGYSPSFPWIRAETGFNLVTNWTKIVRNHTVKWGVDLRRIRDDLNQNDVYGARGQFQFGTGTTALNGNSQQGFGNAYASFLLDLPSLLGRSMTIMFPAYRQLPIFTYVEDKWQVTPKLTLDIGIRYEYWAPPKPRLPGGFSNYDPNTNSLLLAGIGNVPKNMGEETNWRDFAPRFGLAYRLNEKTVVRVGFGISIIPPNDRNYAYNYPVKLTEAHNAANSYQPAGSMAAGFPPLTSTLVPIPANGVITNAPLTLNYIAYPAKIPEGSVRSWNVSIQRSLPWRFMLEAAYVGNQAVNVYTTININAAQVPGTGAAGQPLNIKFGRLAETDQFYPTQNDYHSLQVKFDRRVSDRFVMTTAYTFSKALDWTDENTVLYIPAVRGADRGRAGFSRTHVFVQSYVYELPFGKRGRWLRSGLGQWAFGDWQVNGLFTSMTGLPLGITDVSAALNAPGNGNRPNVSGKPQILGGTGPGQLWFATSQFSAPPSATFGNVGRNILSGPGFVNLDFSLFRKFDVTERLHAELRCEAYNLTNTPHFDNPNGEFTSAAFGQISTDQPTSVPGQRQIQFALKLRF